MKKINCCSWCHAFCTEPQGFDSKTKLIVCSPECKEGETNFHIFFSDKEIGERNFRDYGVNPNLRGKKRGQSV